MVPDTEAKLLGQAVKAKTEGKAKKRKATPT